MLIVAISCKKEETQIQTNLNGTYIGIFERKGESANVELTFKDGSFNGKSEKANFPAICNGTYTISGNNITFTDSCFWTANFDWTLILKDHWEFNLNNKALILTKSNGDQYSLTQQ